MGSSTGVAISGTVEEIDRFAAAGKPAMIYFSERPVNPSTIDLTQLGNLRDFKSATYTVSLTGSFKSPDDLQHQLFKQLSAPGATGETKAAAWIFQAGQGTRNHGDDHRP
jgi:hypothetical protein